MVGKTLALLVFLVLLFPSVSMANGPGRIYTKVVADDPGLISGKVKGAVLTHAIAVERDRTRVYLGKPDARGTGFRFEKLPIGRYDLVLVTTDSRVIEGLELGATSSLTGDREKHLNQGVVKADSFFNRHVTHRVGVGNGVALVFVERIRDRKILRGSGEVVDACLRRLEIIELREADDDWQMVKTRHLYREETPRIKDIPFLTHQHLPALGGLRVAGNPRDLGTVDLSNL